jgi:large subunit ribosomal protein L16
LPVVPFPAASSVVEDLHSRVFPDKPITEKPLEVRMGNGKGNVEYWVCEIKPGKILYEIEGVSDELAREAFVRAAAKLPFKTTIVTRTVM